MSETGAPPPGWYPDPAGGGGSRWWDGATWGGQAVSGVGAPPLAAVGARFGALLLDGLIVSAAVILVLLPVAVAVGALGSQGGGMEVVGIVIGLLAYLAVLVAAFC